jgi:uncharacterized protein (DUF952 family)
VLQINKRFYDGKKYIKENPMVFKIAINSILRLDNYPELTQGQIYTFEKQDSHMFFDNIPVWLANTDWTARAEISIVSQTLENNTLNGTFRVNYVYQKDEQQALSNIFVRMYAGLSDKNIYLLSSQAEYRQALDKGMLIRDSLQSEGFIHASPKSQLNRLANKYYQNKIQPLILVVEKKLISEKVRWEPATGGLYPHIYGPLNTSAITKVEEISLAEDGNFHL